MNQTKIISFIQDVLGCGCPSEVFNEIEYEKDVNLGPDLKIDARFNIGNRLLVYLLDSEHFNASNKSLKRSLLNLLKHGKAERNTKKLNRFRLVVISNKDNNELVKEIQALFQDTRNIDEKMHLHILKGSINQYNFD